MMSDPVKKDDALATAVRDAFQKHMEQARMAAMAPKSDQVVDTTVAQMAVAAPPSLPVATGLPKARLQPQMASNDVSFRAPDLDQTESRGDRSAMKESKAPVAAAEKKDPLRKPPSLSPSRLDPALRPQSDAIPQKPVADPASEPPKPAEPPSALTALAAKPVEARSFRSEPPIVDRAPLRSEVLRSRTGPTEIKLDNLLTSDMAASKRGAERHESVSTARRDAARDQVVQRPSAPVVAELPPRSRATDRRGLYAVAALVALALIGAGTLFVFRPQALHETAAPSPVQPLKPVATVDPAKVQTIVTRQVKTTAIKLDTIDLAIQEARERIAAGEVDYARLMLSGLQGTGDARVMMAMGETFDPALTHNAVSANPQLAIRFYEAAQKAGFPGAAERIGRLTAKAN